MPLDIMLKNYEKRKRVLGYCSEVEIFAYFRFHSPPPLRCWLLATVSCLTFSACLRLCPTWRHRNDAWSYLCSWIYQTSDVGGVCCNPAIISKSLNKTLCSRHYFEQLVIFCKMGPNVILFNVQNGPYHGLRVKPLLTKQWIRCEVMFA